MGRVLKILGIGLGVVLALLVAVVVGVWLFFDPNDYRDDIAAAVERETGRELVIEGDLELGLFPWLSIDVGATRLGNAGGFGDEPFVSFDRASLGIRLLPLLSGRVEIGEAALDGLVLNLAVAEDGRTNWDSLTEVGAEEPSAEPAPETGDEAFAMRDFSVGGIALTGATVTYDDAASGSRYRIENLELATGAIRPGERFAVDGGFSFLAMPDGPSGSVTLDAGVELDQEAGRVLLDSPAIGLELEPEQSGSAYPPARLEASAIRYGYEAGSVALDELVFEMAELTLRGALTGEGLDAEPRYEGTLTVERFSPKALAESFAVEGPPTNDPDALTRARLGASFAAGADSLAISDLELQLDDTTATGSFRVEGFEQPAYRFELTADEIDLDRYVSPAPEDADESREDAAALDATDIPVELIRGLDLEGTASLGRAKLGGLVFTDLELGVTGKGGVLRLHPLSASFYEGQYTGDVRIDASGQTPRLSLDERAEGIALGPLAEDMFETEEITGSFSGSFQLAGTGKNIGEIRRMLEGNVAFELADGAWKGTDLWYQIRRARAVVKREPPPPAPDEPQTEFTEARGTGVVDEGVLRNQDLFARLPFMQVTGAGSVDLAAATLDYGLRARILERPDFLEGATEEELDEYTEAVIPIKVTGELSEPSIQPDIAGLVRSEVKERIDEKKDELKRRLIDRLGGGSDEGEAGQEAPAEGVEPNQAQPEEEEDPEEKLKKKLLDDLFG